jgi:hypothetical protein
MSPIFDGVDVLLAVDRTDCKELARDDVFSYFLQCDSSLTLCVKFGPRVGIYTVSTHPSFPRGRPYCHMHGASMTIL